MASPIFILGVLSTEISNRIVSGRSSHESQADRLIDILLDHLGEIKIVDFGAAKILTKTQQKTLIRTRVGSNPGLPAAAGLPGLGNTLTGTPMYMSPEVIRSERRGPQEAVDIWSLGCVILECVTGKKPWSNLDNEWCDAIQNLLRFHSPHLS
jgi:mitogen-activated protein kinase kinase kinase